MPLNLVRNVELFEIRSEHRLDYKVADVILILNDNCFLQIFKYLSLIDLANFKETYKCRGPVADMEFCRKTRRSFGFCCNRNKNEMIQIMEQFGSSISRLTLHWKVKIFVANRYGCWTYKGSRYFRDRRRNQKHRKYPN